MKIVAYAISGTLAGLAGALLAGFLNGPHGGLQPVGHRPEGGVRPRPPRAAVRRLRRGDPDGERVPYGLSSYLFTSDVDRAMRAVDDIEAGEVYINKIGPEQLQGFLTGSGLSGMGGDDGVYGYERYSRRKTLYLRHGSAAAPSNLG